MVERKPPGVSFESWVDKQIREATERGEMDDLPGAGRRLPSLDRPEDDSWLTGYLRREGISTEELLPTPLRLRKEIERLPDTIRELASEDQVRTAARDLNRRIADWISTGIGPRLQVGPVNVEDVVRQWHADRAVGESSASHATRPAEPERAATGPERTRKWPFRRRIRRD